MTYRAIVRAYKTGFVCWPKKLRATKEADNKLNECIDITPTEVFKSSPKKWWITLRLSKTFCSIVWSVFNGVPWCIYLTRNRQFCLNSWINGFFRILFSLPRARDAHCSLSNLVSFCPTAGPGPDKKDIYVPGLLVYIYAPKYWRSEDICEIKIKDILRQVCNVWICGAVGGGDYSPIHVCIWQQPASTTVPTLSSPPPHHRPSWGKPLVRKMSVQTEF